MYRIANHTKYCRMRLSQIIDLLYEFDDRHFGIIPLAGDGPENASVPAFLVAVPVRSCLEEGMDQLLVVDPSHGLSTRVQVTALAQLDHVIHVFPNRLGPDQGRLDPAVSDHFGRKGAQQRLPLIGRLPQRLKSLPMAHHGKMRPRSGRGLALGLHRVERSPYEGASACDCQKSKKREQKTHGEPVTISRRFDKHSRTSSVRRVASNHKSPKIAVQLQFEIRAI